MLGTSIQRAIQSKYKQLYVIHIERDRGLRWETEEPTPVIISDDFLYALGALRGYLTNMGNKLTGDYKVIEHLQEFFQLTHSIIVDYKEPVDYEVPDEPYQAHIKLDQENKEFEMTFEYLSNHLYISLDNVNTKSIYMLMDNL